MVKPATGRKASIMASVSLGTRATFHVLGDVDKIILGQTINRCKLTCDVCNRKASVMIDWRDILILRSRHPTNLHGEHRQILYLSPGPKIKTPAYYLLEGTAKAVVMSFDMKCT